jgi:hypothetical protein
MIFEVLSSGTFYSLITVASVPAYIKARASGNSFTSPE